MLYAGFVKKWVMSAFLKLYTFVNLTIPNNFRKWAINSAFMVWAFVNRPLPTISHPSDWQVFYAFAATLICWVIWAYKMAFGEQWGKLPLVGTPGPVLTMQQNLAQATLPAAGLSPNFNLSTMIYFQFVFAAITVIILGGSLLGRMNLLAWMVFVPLWITLSYTVGAFRLVFQQVMWLFGLC